MLNFKKRLWIIRQKEKQELTDNKIAVSQRITRRAVQKIWHNYKINGLTALQDKPKGRKIDEIPVKIQNKILEIRKDNSGIHRIGCLLRQENIHISERKIIRVLKQNNLNNS